MKLAFMSLFLLALVGTFAKAAAVAGTSLSKVQLIEPADVAKLLPFDTKNEKKPLVLHIGFKVLFDIAHIPGSKYLGPANKPEGLKLLRDYLAKQPHDREIILYCGCCPMTKCPNYKVAYDEVKSLGFTKVSVIHMPENFATDWTKKGFPIEK